MKHYFEENKIELGHGRRSLQSGAVALMARAANAFIQIGSVLFLARLLSPEDYGLVSMVTSVTGFAQVFVDLGTRDAVSQRRQISEGEVSALFWTTVGIGSLFALLIALGGPFLSRFYGEPRLTAIAVVSSLTFVTTALSCQHYALLRRVMAFRALSIIEVTANVVSALGAILLAFSGFHYWALVLRPVAMTGLTALGVWWVCRWVPKKPEFTPGVTQMLKFGANSTGFTMTDFAGRSADRVAVGYRSGPRGLGYYQNAFFIYDNLLDVLVFPLHGVAVTSLAKVRGNLPELKRLWAKALMTLAFFAMPAFGLLASTSQDIVVMLLGAKWASAGTLLTILALRGIPHCVERTLGWLHVTAGRTDRWMKWGIFATILQLIALAVGIPYGPTGVVTAYTVAMFVTFLPALAYAGRPLEIGARDVVTVVWRPMLGALLSVAACFFLRTSLLADIRPFTRTAITATAFAGAYLVIVAGALGVRTPITVVLSLVRDMLPARFSMKRQAVIDSPEYEHS